MVECVGKIDLLHPFYKLPQPYDKKFSTRKIMFGSKSTNDYFKPFNILPMYIYTRSNI